ncbi:flagellar hook-basal body complex protein [Methylobacterium sp. J-030]|uniref:flagellar hook basal-body protein n=1 Tax=Methylobacterium sp. J-030 TaxID=2836627 RepID=UPI001FBACC3E|nr:flagellar hook basal-body protein [Methylobacterium sp. J-030]MCJ2069775.1 flagellar hook-basal body complex protein [Methylobacterium sp. J-030]
MSLFDALSNSISGASAQSFALNNISGNIANTQTAGFKTTETSFADMLAQTEAGTQPAGGVGSSTRDTLGLQGTMQSTGVSTNLGIQGSGYFIVRANTGTDQSPTFTGQTAYTRRGDFTPDANGYLVNGAGYYLFAGPSATAPVTVPTGANTLADLSISSAGAITGTAANGSTVPLGTLTLAQFGTQENLTSLDGGAYVANGQSETPTYGLNGATLAAGSVEQSNAGIADQFSKMIETQQAYTANTKVMSTADQMLQDAIAMYA